MMRYRDESYEFISVIHISRNLTYSYLITIPNITSLSGNYEKKPEELLSYFPVTQPENVNKYIKLQTDVL